MTTTANGRPPTPVPAQGGPPKPDLLPIVVDDIPEELIAYPQWVCWRLVWNPKKHKGQGGWDKPPYNALTGHKASTTNRDTWATFEAALNGMDQHGFDGVGFVLDGEDPFTGLDWDDVRLPDGSVRPDVLAEIRHLDSYTEWSPRNNSLHTWVDGRWPKGTPRPKGVEITSEDGYLTVTGHHLDGTLWAIEPRQAELDSLRASPSPSPPPPPAPSPAPGGVADDDDFGGADGDGGDDGDDDDGNPTGDLLDRDVLLTRASRRLREKIDTLRPDGDRSKRLHNLIRQCSREHFSEAEAYALLSGTPNDKFTDQRTNGDDYLWRDILKGYAEERAEQHAATPGSSPNGSNPPASASPGAESPGAVIGNRFRLLSRDQLMERPDPRWLIDGVLPDNALAAICGQPGHFKSFVALSVACSVACGVDWYGHALHRAGPVVYVSAEGSGGLKKRVCAWEIATGATADALYTLPEAVQLLDPEQVDALLAAIADLGIAPALLCVDTLARTMAGDENSARDMGAYVASLDRLRVATGATILTVHHNTKSNGLLRGSSALLGALDTVLDVDRSGANLTVETAKQKDFEPLPALGFTAVAVPAADSLVLHAVHPVTAAFDRLIGDAKHALDALDALGDATHTAWERAALAAGLSRGGFDRVRLDLLTAGRVEKTGTGRGVRYRVLPPRGVAADAPSD